MPPKKSGPSVKSIEKQKQKIIEDKTFGMKNKNKSKKVQKEIEHIAHRVQQSGPKWTKEELEERERKKLEKLAAKQREKELKDLFKVVPSASSAVQANEGTGGSDEDDEDENEEDVEPTELDMLDALESLAEVEKELDEEEEMTLEEVIEKERSKIVNGTPVTAETFFKWKQFKLEQKAKEEERLRKLSIAAYKQSGTGLSGKALFEVDQSLFVDDAEATDELLKVEDAEIDADLFLDDEEDAAEEETAVEESKPAKQYPKGVIVEDGELIYDAENWEDKANPPKGLLFDWFAKRKITQLPKFEPVPMLEKGEGSLLKVILTHLNPPKEFIPTKVSPNKKIAENVASLQAYYYLKEAEEEAQQQ